jgi:hypothetical protein
MGRVDKKIILKKETKFLGNWFFPKKNLHGEKEKFVEFTSPTLINYLVAKCRPCLWTTVVDYAWVMFVM